jgi:hypothetical protein
VTTPSGRIRARLQHQPAQHDHRPTSHGNGALVLVAADKDEPDEEKHNRKNGAMEAQQCPER